MFLSLCGCELTRESWHWFAASTLLLSNDQLVYGPNGGRTRPH